MKTYEADTIYKFNRFAPDWLATSSVMNFCEENECYWVLDIVASYAKELKSADYLKVITVDVDVVRSTAVFKVTDEINGLLITQEIGYTDLKENIKWWGVDQEDKTILMEPKDY